MTASNLIMPDVNFPLASRGPSTHATSRRARGRWLARRVDVQADDVPKLRGERRVGRQLEAPHPMRRQARLPDPLHFGRGDAARLGHRAHRPVRGLAGRRLVQGPADHPADLGRAQGRDPRRPGPIAQQPVDAGREIALLPPPDRRLGQTRPAHDLGGAKPIRAQQHHLARQTCFCALFRSATIAARRARSATPTNKPRFPRIRAP